MRNSFIVVRLCKESDTFCILVAKNKKIYKPLLFKYVKAKKLSVGDIVGNGYEVLDIEKMSKFSARFSELDADKVYKFPCIQTTVENLREQFQGAFWNIDEKLLNDNFLYSAETVFLGINFQDKIGRRYFVSGEVSDTVSCFTDYKAIFEEKDFEIVDVSEFKPKL